MSPIMWAGIAVAVFIAGALLLRSLNAQQSVRTDQPVASVVPQLFASHEPLRMRSQFEVETDEDLQAIEFAYRENRRAERARLALERLAPLVPSGASKK